MSPTPSDPRSSSMKRAVTITTRRARTGRPKPVPVTLWGTGQRVVRRRRRFKLLLVCRKFIMKLTWLSPPIYRIVFPIATPNGRTLLKTQCRRRLITRSVSQNQADSTKTPPRRDCRVRPSTLTFPTRVLFRFQKMTPAFLLSKRRQNQSWATQPRLILTVL